MTSGALAATADLFPTRDDFAAPRPIRVGLLGCGHVGSAVAKLLLEEPGRVGAAVGIPVELARIAVAHPEKERPVRLPRGRVTTDGLSVVCDPDIDVVIEVIGGISPARELILAAISDGKSVISANKELLALHGAELHAAAEEKGVHLLYEAAVCAAVPILRCLRESLAATPLTRITAILNGTTNFILTRMQEHNCSFADALREAQELGYAEADPSADVTGRDAACKAILLATVASGARPLLVESGGITGVTPRVIEAARSHGKTLKLVAEIDLNARPAPTSVKVTSLSLDHPLARVGGVDNGVLIETADGAELFFSGPGAGGEATAVAVLGDLVQVAKERVQARDARRLACV